MSSIADSIRVGLLVSFGALEGYAFATSGITYPSAFRSQMNFSKFILMRLFLSAVGSSMLVQSVLNALHVEKFDNSRVWKYTSAGFQRVVVGCFILGCGMTIAGSGPTMLPSQLGVGTSSAFWILGGSIFGGVVFSILEQAGHFSTSFTPRKEEKLVLEHFIGGHYSIWAFLFGSTLMGAAYALPMLLPAVANEVSTLSPFLTTSPLFAGLAVGINQIPVRLISECGQGGSRAIMQIVATLTGNKVAKRFKIENLSGAHQLFYVWGGTLLGALFASRTLNLPVPQGYGPVESFVGGALMIFGARVAAGCACGHGVSGFSELSIQSMAGAAAMFVGGITTMLLSRMQA